MRAWLFSLLPPSVYDQPVLRRHNDALLHFADSALSGTLEGLRRAYATARVELGPALPPESIAAALRALTDVGSELAAAQAFVQWLREQRVG